MDKIAELTDDDLFAEGKALLEALHDYELICLHGSSGRERELGRAARDRLTEVCTEIGVRFLADRFHGLIAQHLTAYLANLSSLASGAAADESERATGRLSWWNL